LLPLALLLVSLLLAHELLENVAKLRIYDSQKGQEKQNRKAVSRHLDETI
jgi:hypothetical protein